MAGDAVFSTDNAIGNKPLGVNMGLTVLYLAEIALAGYRLIKR